MAWTEDDSTNNVEMAMGDLNATPGQWAEIHKLSARTDWKKSLTREQAAELISILDGKSYEEELGELLDAEELSIPAYYVEPSDDDSEDDYGFCGEAA